MGFGILFKGPLGTIRAIFRAILGKPCRGTALGFTTLEALELQSLGLLGPGTF